MDEASGTHERFEITRNGQRVAVLLGANDHDALQETVAVLSDSELVRDHLAGLRAIEGDEALAGEQLASLMRVAGRLPSPE